MKKILVLLLLSLIGLSVFAYSLNDVLLNNFNTVMTLSKYEQKDAIIVFSDPNCFYCNKLKSDTLSNLDVQHMLSNNFVIGEIYETNETANFQGNTYTYTQLFQGFGIKGTPTLFFFTSTGTPITYLPGYLGPSDFLKVLQYIALGDYAKNVDFNTFAKGNSNFVGTSSIIRLTVDQADYILKNDPLSRKIDSYPPKNADPFLKYVISGQDAVSMANQMLKNGFYNIYVVDGK
jgi:thioredoxin-related protein